MDAFIGLLVLLGILYVLIFGGIQTFQRNWILALLMLLFLTPIWVCWAFVEVFLDKPTKKPMEVNVNVNQNVN